MTDSLAPGGLERVAVNLANSLPRERYHSHLCCTREGGPLASLVNSDVHRLDLQRRGRLDLRAIRRLAEYIQEHKIKILHAHGTSLFTAVLVSLLKPYPAVVWHDHFGRYATETRPVWLYRLATRRVAGVITVSQPLAQWSRERLRVETDRVWRVPNFVSEPRAIGKHPELPGNFGLRIVCVANLRPEKDHPTLLEAMRWVVKEMPETHLLLLGRSGDKIYSAQVHKIIAESGLAANVTWLGSRADVHEILRNCEVGVLSSLSEGAPLALIEYGFAGLAVVATRVGQCAEILDEGRCGLLVPPSAPELLGKAILTLIKSCVKRAALGNQFKQHVLENYSEGRIIKQLDQIYETVLNGRGQERI
ncbi:glycosyltransferase family 4 protein [Pedosphaera parvula]|uniref:glycosyltransferase family 4 protein n=1 Tax=Pedosphaera parvula TaxID=1032527 RepID=UPI00135F130D|nr:glycosyltransferase family 4 protein [Pedosphaera parvula]